MKYYRRQSNNWTKTSDMHNVGIYCLLQCQCQFIIVDLIHSTCLYLRAENMRMNCHCWLHLIKLFFRTAIAISDTRSELSDPPFDLCVELVVDHGSRQHPSLLWTHLLSTPAATYLNFHWWEGHSRIWLSASHLPFSFTIRVYFAWPLPWLSSGCLLAQFSGRNLSGSKVSGSG